MAADSTTIKIFNFLEKFYYDILSLHHAISPVTIATFPSDERQFNNFWRLFLRQTAGGATTYFSAFPFFRENFLESEWPKGTKLWVGNIMKNGKFYEDEKSKEVCLMENDDDFWMNDG
uniref:Uncharacterized protein n=1 Tax=Caenorhabditis elegans TaxID=6239 RepID=P91362_CAEEL|eukprot:NP_491622.1 Uncharacterized protein CELE_F59A3.10 [Caenorhabditis elegans]